MKKVITIVLALVMVFAIAAPAMAMTDAPLGTPGSASDLFDVSIRLAGGMPGYGTSLMVPDVAANKAYVANEAVYYVAYLTAKSGVASTNRTNLRETDIVLSGNGVNIAAHTPTIYVYTGGQWRVGNSTPVVNTTDNTISYVATDFPYVANQYAQYAFAGYGVVTGAVAEPSISVAVKINSMEPGINYAGVNMGTKQVEIIKTADGVYQVNVAGESTTIFTMNTSTNKCIRIQFQLINGALVDVTYGQYYDNATGAYVSDYLFNGQPNPTPTAKPLFLEVMNYFGFDYSKINTNAVLEGHFLAKVAAANVAATVAVPLYTQTVIIPQPDQIQPPKTGDAASTLGFVMIAAAIVAAAALAYRKVRA